MSSQGRGRIRERLGARAWRLAEQPEPPAAEGTRANEQPLEPEAEQPYEQAEAEELAAQLEAIRESESFRIGHAIVRFLRGPRALRRRPWTRTPRKQGALRRAIASLRGREAALEREPLEIPPGNHLLGPLNNKHSTVMFIAWGLDQDKLATLIREVAQLQLMLRDFKPLFITDSDFWDPFFEYGYWFEYIPPFEEWTRSNDPIAWPDYVGERTASIMATYRPRRVVVYEGGPVGEVLRRGVLNSVIGRPGRPTEKAALRPPQREGAL
jgi:hypothetical protein